MTDSFNDVLSLLSGHALVRSIAIVAELRVPDALVAGPRSAAELARECKAHEGSLFRLMRALAAIGVFTQTDTPPRFGLTPLSNWLRSDVPNSLRDFARLRGGELCWQAWGPLQQAVETGDCAFERQYGNSFFGYLHEHPNDAHAFNDSMRSLSSQVHAAVIRAYDFMQFRTITDVGGGSGAFVSSLLTANANLHAILFDRAPAIARSAEVLATRQVADRCRCIAGDFFEAVPLGSESILLSRVLHDFSDEDCLRILGNCHAALPRGGRLLIVEYVVDDSPAGTAAKLFDLHMLVYFGAARERSAEEFRALLAKSGFEMQRVVESSALIGVLEATAT
jgi:hypothetical protein